MEIDTSTTTLPLQIDIYPMSFTKFQIYATVDDSFKKQQDQPSAFGQASTGGELEEFKRMLLETNPILLVTTLAVSLLHSLFEMLAFKSDISHWRNKKDNVGISVRSVLSNVVMQIIIFLYLMDNNDNTSWLILGGQGEFVQTQ